jgi:hypothetical protein
MMTSKKYPLIVSAKNMDQWAISHPDTKSIIYWVLKTVKVIHSLIRIKMTRFLIKYILSEW